MLQNLLSQKNRIIIIIVLVVISSLGYFGYSFWQVISSASDAAAVDSSLLNPNLRAFYDVKDKIKLTENDLAFTKKPFYKELKDNTVEFPPSVPKGRPNPFWAP